MRNVKLKSATIILSSVIGLTACMPHTSREYYKPSYAGAVYEEGECSAGPDEYVVINTQQNVKIKVKANKHELGAEVIVLLEVPQGVQAYFTDNTFQISASNNSIYYYAASPDEVVSAEDDKGVNQYRTQFVTRTGAVSGFNVLVPPLAVGKKIYSFKSVAFKNAASGWGITSIGCE
jgi:hypothetical protein